MILRGHQSALKKHISGLDAGDMPADILVDVVPGGGKSMLPGILAARFPGHRIAWFVPRLSLARQAAIGMMKDFGIEIRESGNDTDPSRGTRGFVATHAALTQNPDLWLDEMRRHQYLLVLDELHHAKQDRSGRPNKLAAALAGLPYYVRLGMTGTLETNDRSLIYNVPYRGVSAGWEVDLESFDGEVIRYGRSSALQEGAIVPVEFHYHDGPVKWEDIAGVRECRLSEVERDGEAAAIWTALRTDHADQLLDCCLQHWREFGDRLLVVTADQSSARACCAKLLRLGVSCGLAISDADDPHSDIERFREGEFDCLVTCQMAYEGLDVPRITHIACLTHIRSSPWIEQMLARAWRAREGKSRCWAFVPDDPRMNRVIERIRSEQESVIPYQRDAVDGGGPGGDRAFVPISGEVLAVTTDVLDGSHIRDPIAEEVAGLCRKFDFPTDHPSVAQFLSALRCGGGERREKTVAERERTVRNGMKAACNAADRRKGLEPGTHQKRLHKALGYKTFDSMTLKELEHARSVCTRVCS